jgi:hypothetical protein
MSKVTVADVAPRPLTPGQQSPFVALRRRSRRTNPYAWRLWRGTSDVSEDMRRRRHGEPGVPLDARSRWHGRKLPSGVGGNLNAIRRRAATR